MFSNAYLFSIISVLKPMPAVNENRPNIDSLYRYYLQIPWSISVNEHSVYEFTIPSWIYKCPICYILHILLEFVQIFFRNKNHQIIKI